MKIVIQNPVNLYYVTAQGTWTAEIREALVFDNFRAAVEFFSDHRMRDARIVLGIEEDARDLRPPFLPHPALATRNQSGNSLSGLEACAEAG